MKTSWAIGRFKLNADWNPLRASRPRQERRSLFRTSRGKTVERQAVESLDVVGGLVVDNPRLTQPLVIVFYSAKPSAVIDTRVIYCAHSSNAAG